MLGAVAVIVFMLWRGGQFMRLANFTRETRDEVMKCSWPTWNELKGSTVVVMISIALLGGFTAGVDAIFMFVMRIVSSI